MPRFLGASIGALIACAGAIADAAPPQPCVDSPFVWQAVETGAEALDQRLDLDGDGKLDRLTGTASWGSSDEIRTVTVELSRDGSTIEASTNSSFATMVERQPIPPPLLALPDALRAVEYALFGRVCSVPDPSLARVVASAPVWSAGLPVLVDNYAVRVGNEWITYAALNHKRTAKLDLRGGFVIAARRGSLVLKRTAHGVVLVDERRKRASWLFVVEQAERKLRFPSVASAKFRGDRAIIVADGKQIEVALPK